MNKRKYDPTSKTEGQNIGNTDSEMIPKLDGNHNGDCESENHDNLKLEENSDDKLEKYGDCKSANQNDRWSSKCKELAKTPGFGFRPETKYARSTDIRTNRKLFQPKRRQPLIGTSYSAANGSVCYNVGDNGVSNKKQRKTETDSINENKIPTTESEIKEKNDYQAESRKHTLECKSEYSSTQNGSDTKYTINVKQKDGKRKEESIIDEPDFAFPKSPLRRPLSDESPSRHLKDNIYSNDRTSFSKTYPGRGRRTQIGNEDDLDTDIIIPSEVSSKHLANPPANLSDNFTHMDPRKQPLPRSTSILQRIGILPEKEPEQKSIIYIPHKNADKPVGDEFGAQIWTYRIDLKDGAVYHQHFYTSVVKDGPAHKMKICENDELVLMNGVFVPYISHTDLLNLFHKVPVDGHTRLKFIVRRVESLTKGNKRIWDWIETSAVLAPDLREQLDQYPIVEKLEVKSETGDGKEVEPCIKEYNVPGTQRYLDIRDDMVTATVFTGQPADRTKSIWKRARFQIDNTSDIFVRYWAALANEDRTKYISIDSNRNITLDANPFWFEYLYLKEPDTYRIWFKAKGLYMSCNKETFKFRAESNIFLFDEITPKKLALDCPDGHLLGRYSDGSSIDNIGSKSTELTPAVTDSCSCVENAPKGNSDTLKNRCASCRKANFINGGDNRSLGYNSQEDEELMDTSMSLNLKIDMNYAPTSNSEALRTPTTPFEKMSV